MRVDIINDTPGDPSLLSVCPGYEQSRWRDKEMARDVFDRHLLSFASTFSTYSTVTGDTAANDLRAAALRVYQTDKYSRRGEYGELLLHAILRDIYRTEPAVSKIAFEDGPNETVKGFDAVHVVVTDNGIELWLGEVKFYPNVTDAIRDVTKELGTHTGSSYLRNEFAAIGAKVDSSWRHAAKVNLLLDANTSLDEIFDVLTIPVLLTYESRTVKDSTRVSDEYIAGLKSEAINAWEKFRGKLGPEWAVQIRLILLPLKSKEATTACFHERLEAWQRI